MHVPQFPLGRLLRRVTTFQTSNEFALPHRLTGRDDESHFAVDDSHFEETNGGTKP